MLKTSLISTSLFAILILIASFAQVSYGFNFYCNCSIPKGQTSCSCDANSITGDPLRFSISPYEGPLITVHCKDGIVKSITMPKHPGVMCSLLTGDNPPKTSCLNFWVTTIYINISGITCIKKPTNGGLTISSL